jgi:hypothetical protein
MFCYNNLDQEGIITCDECGEEEIYSGTFKGCISDAKEEGWKVTFNNKEDCFKHYCQDCKEF